MYSFYVSGDVRMSRTTGTVSFPRLLQAYLQRYLPDSVHTEKMKKVTQTRQQPDEDKKKYEDRSEDYAAEWNSF